VTKRKSFDVLAVTTGPAPSSFPWALVDKLHHNQLCNDARDISEGRAKELSALMQQARACWDAHKRVRTSLFRSWIKSQTKLSVRSAYRLIKCYDRVGAYHDNAVRSGKPSPLERFDYGTILYVLSDESLCPQDLLEDLLNETYLMMDRGEPIRPLPRRYVTDLASRRRLEQSSGVSSRQAPRLTAEHMHSQGRSVSKDLQKLANAQLPKVQQAAQYKDEHGKDVPVNLCHIFAAREHFARIRKDLTELAKQVHALAASPAGKDINSGSAAKLLAVAEDLNLSCPALLDDATGSKRPWISAKTVMQRTYSRESRYGRRTDEQEAVSSTSFGDPLQLPNTPR
jgi:hypothetical protein